MTTASLCSTTILELLSQQLLQLLKARAKRHFWRKILLLEGLLQEAVTGKVLVCTGNLLRCQEKPLHQQIPGQETPQSTTGRQIAIVRGSGVVRWMNRDQIFLL